MTATPSRSCEIAIVGGGIVGASTARILAEEHGCSVVLLEAEERLAGHQSGRNSGVVHAGLYYKPGSLKARNCAAGRELMLDFCAAEGLPHERCGKLVVAVDDSQLPALEELERRGRANGLEGLERLGADEVRAREPHVRAVAGLLVPVTAIADFAAVTDAFARRAEAAGAEIRRGWRVSQVLRSGSLELRTDRGALTCDLLVNCAGLHADRVARLCGLDPAVRIIPFRGEYWELVPERRGLVNHLVYPVPDPRFPFLGVHLTRRLDGRIEVGPNALLALKRTGYRRGSFSLRDTLATFAWPGFWKLAARHWRTGAGELLRSCSRRALVKELRRMLPEARPDDLFRARSGIRAQALGRDGSLVDDFVIEEGERMLHVLNAPSPGATASIAIGGHIAQRALKLLPGR